LLVAFLVAWITGEFRYEFADIGGNMAKGQYITGEVKTLIAGVYMKHPKWTARRIRDEVSFILRERNPNLSYKWPGLSIVQKSLATIHKRAKALANEPQDKLWSLMSLPKYPVPGEAIPHVLKVWALALEEGNPLTIREAIWTAWLYPIFGEAFKAHRLETVEILKQAGIEEIKEVPPSLEDGELTLGSSLRLRKGEGMEAIATRELLAWARDYAIRERLLKLSGRDEYPETPDELLSFWFDDADMFACLVGKE